MSTRSYKKTKSIEAEVVTLKAVVEMIDSMVNKSMIELRGKDTSVQVFLRTHIHKKFFYIILVDFLAGFNSKLLGQNVTAVSLLGNICAKPNFAFEGNGKLLKKSVRLFSAWINKEIVREKTWFSSIDKELDLKIKRGEYIRICGNVSKHSFLRLTRTHDLLKAILERNGIFEIAPEAMNMLLNEFYEQFHEDVLGYHNSFIAEMLNNIRWGIHEYLLPEFIKSYTKIDSLRYEYKYPEQIESAYAKACYWDLMNDVRSQPNIKKFKVTKYLKMRY